MKWFDFTDKTFVIFAVIIILVVVFLVFIAISFGVSSHRDNKYIERMKTEATTVRVYTIDAKNNSVIYFNRSDLKNKKQIDMNSLPILQMLKRRLREMRRLDPHCILLRSGTSIQT